jgi:hypothetical protein
VLREMRVVCFTTALLLLYYRYVYWRVAGVARDAGRSCAPPRARRRCDCAGRDREGAGVSHFWYIRQHTSAYVSAYLSIRQIGKEHESLISGTEFTCFTSRKVPMFTSDEASDEATSSPCVSIRQHTPAYVSIRQHTLAYASIRQHTSAYVSIRQHTSALVSIRQHTSAYVSSRQHVIMQQAHLRRNRCCFTAALPLLYSCFTSAALLLLYFRLC